MSLDRCWICGGRDLRPVHRLLFEFSNYERQDPGLARYTDQRLDLVRCRACGFAQPAGLPTLPDYFGRMYDQRWSADWMAREFASGYKDLIFHSVLGALARLVPAPRRRLLDLGAHVGRLLRLARDAGWTAEGVELNPQTAAFAAHATGLPVHRADARTLIAAGRQYDAVTLIDVLEHIPDPVAMLATARALVAPGGWIAVKVPHGPVQLRKEIWRARVVRGYRATVADNLVHVNHFSPRTLALALERAGFGDVHVGPAAPEITQPEDAPRGRRWAMNGMRRTAYALARILPGGTQTPFTLHLQAYARAEQGGPARGAS
ncbi:MAG: class I SAM-dependent methyltransferase [Gemmatimonadota bacterium]|nr:class I SAM-dependent methyltransferase [Gemmatimonadota bacterium]MDE3217285.1 class I SAM-dependent methyltransferase [Gemmatimonadota bacterium]